MFGRTAVSKGKTCLLERATGSATSSTERVFFDHNPQGERKTRRKFKKVTILRVLAITLPLCVKENSSVGTIGMKRLDKKNVTAHHV